LRAKMTPESRAWAEAETKRLIAEMPLNSIRRARELTQEDLAAILEIDQSEVSKIERRTDMYVSTLARFIRAMGGELEIRAVFPDQSIRIASLTSD